MAEDNGETVIREQSDSYFQTILQNPGLSHIPFKIVSFLPISSVFQFSQVSSACDYHAFKTFEKKLNSTLSDLKLKTDFFTYFPKWIEVFDYFETCQSFFKIWIFLDGMLKFHSNCDYIFTISDIQDHNYSRSFFGTDNEGTDNEDEVDIATEKFEQLKELRIPKSHPIHYAIETSNLDFLKVLIDSPADFNAQAEWSIITPIIAACKINQSKEVTDLFISNIIKKNIRLDVCNVEGSSRRNPLHHALHYDFGLPAEDGNPYAAFQLIKFAVTNPDYNFIITPNTFTRACYKLSQSNPDVIKYMIENSSVLGIDLNYQDKKGRTGFHRAIECFNTIHDPAVQESQINIWIIDYILENSSKFNINVDMADKNGLTPFLLLCHECSKSQDGLIELFVKHKHLINFHAKWNSENAYDLNGESAYGLLVSNLECSIKSVQLIAENCLDSSERNEMEDFQLVLHNQYHLLRRLVARNDTALHCLCKRSKSSYHQQGNLLAKISYLLDTRVADIEGDEREYMRWFGINEKDGDDQTAFQLAIKSGNRDAVLAVLHYNWKNDGKKFETINPDADIPDFIDDENRDSIFKFDTKLRWTEGFQAMMQVLNCTPESCCEDSRLEVVRDLLIANTLDFPITERFIASLECQSMKDLLRKWISGALSTSGSSDLGP